MTGEVKTDSIEAIPFAGPSPQLLELLEYVAACRRDVERVSGMPREVDATSLMEDASDD